MSDDQDGATFNDELLFAPETISVEHEPLQRKTILVVDDDEDMHLITVMVLKKISNDLQLKFHHSYSGKETIQLLNSGAKFDLILLDVVMEDDNAGFKVARHLRIDLDDQKTKIIMCTGQAGFYRYDHMLKGIHIDGFHEKTELSSKKLISIISEALEAS